MGLPRWSAAQAADAATLARHHTVAVLPFKVKLEGPAAVALEKLRQNGVEVADNNAVARERMQQWAARQQFETRQASYQMQELIAAQLAKQRPKRGYQVEFQPVAETNRRLLAAGITYDNLWQQSPSQIQQALGVDAVLSGQVLLHQTLPKILTLAAHFLSNGPLFGAIYNGTPSTDPLFGPTIANVLAPSNTAATLTIDDCQTGQLVWAYDFAREGDNALKPERLAPRLVREALPTFPYRQP